MNELVDNFLGKNEEFSIQGNNISTSLYRCSAFGRKLIAVAIQKIILDESIVLVRSDTKETLPFYKAEFTLTEVCKILNKTRSKRMYEIASNTINELSNCKILIENENEYSAYPWFTKCVYSTKKNKFHFEFNPYVALAIEDKVRGYCKLDMVILGMSKSQYAIGFYELAKSFIGFKGKNGNKPNQWFFDMSIDEIRAKFQIADNEYRELSNLLNRVINEPIKELNKINYEFSIEPLKKKKGRKTVSIRFVCTENQNLNQKTINTDMTTHQKIEIEEVNKERRQIEKLKKLHPEEYAELLETTQKQQEFSVVNSANKLFKERIAENELLKRHTISN